MQTNWPEGKAQGAIVRLRVEVERVADDVIDFDIFWVVLEKDGK